MLIVSWVYGWVMRLRNFLFDRGVLRQYRSTVPVVSIGNIVVGGTGKTPVTLLLGEMLAQKKKKVAILSRGYRSRAEKKAVPMLLNGTERAEECGDEPLLLSRRLPEAFVFVGRNRCRSAKMAVEVGAEVILLDDGMQHRYLQRDLEVIVVDANDPLGGKWLREPLRGIGRADLIVLTNVQEESDLQRTQKQLREYTEAPFLVTRVEVKQVIFLENNKKVDLSDRRVGLFCAIAKPHHFVRTVSDLGADIVDVWKLRDHDACNINKLAQFSRRCQRQGAELLVCTEKDQVKLQVEELSELPEMLPIVFAQTQLQVINGETILNKILNNL